MQVCLTEPFISQDSEKLRFQVEKSPVDECLQQISRILCPTPEGGAVSPRRTAAPTLPRVRILTGHLSIRPDSPCHQLMEHDFGLPDGSISPGLKTFIACVIEQPKQFCCADFAKAKWNLRRLYVRQIGAVRIAIQRRGRLL
jgi:hypothetical protein